MSVHTRGEWRKILERFFSPAEEERGAFFPSSMWPEDWPPEVRHGFAVILLHEQEFGFTRADVRALRRYADQRVTHGHGDYGPMDMYDRANTGWSGLSDLADRLEALLPPEGE